MIHSRPGFATRTSDDAVAKLNADMVPAIYREKKPAVQTSLKQTAREIAADALHARMVAEAQAAAERSGPDLLLNPAPSDPPLVLEPGK